MSQPRAPGQQQIQGMFDDIVERYDLLNGLMTLTMDRGWRRTTARAVQARDGAMILDLGCGTGALMDAFPPCATAAGVDVSAAMLSTARVRMPTAGLVQGSAFSLPFADGSFDGAASAFVLRNLDDRAAAFKELHRVLRPAARISLLDATLPPNRLARLLFEAYFGHAAPWLGALVGRHQAYRYLVRSLNHLPPAGVLCRELLAAGFDQCEFRHIFFGSVTLFTGIRRN